MNTRTFDYIKSMGVALLTLCAGSAVASYPAGYYDSLNGKCGDELMHAVKALCVDHTVITYGNSTWNAFKYTDVRVENGVEYWWDMYSDSRLLVSNGRPNSNDMNIEHSVPKSWWGGTKNDAYQDINHLNPSDATANSRKSNYPLAEVGSVAWTNGVTTVGSPKSGMGGGASNAFEPADEYKGDFARAYMYMFTTYDDIAWKDANNWMYDVNNPLMFKTWAKNMLLRWHRDDPVSGKELSRNEGVWSQQHNRNPFIDLPALANHIWGAQSSEPFDVDAQEPIDPGDDPVIENVNYEWLGEYDADFGDWEFEDVELEDGLSYVWSWNTQYDKHWLNASAFKSGVAKTALSYAWSPAVNMRDVSTASLAFSHAAKYQTTLRQYIRVAVKDVETNEITLLDIPKWPTAGNWNFVESGNIDLAQFKDKKVRVGFKYQSDSNGADTWEVRNVKLELRRASSDIQPLAPEIDDDSDFVEVWGNNILVPAGATIFDLNGRRCDGRNLAKGVYIVVKPTFKKAVKVSIN